MHRLALLLLLVAGCGSVTLADPQSDAAAADVGSAGRRAEGGTGGAAGEVAPPADAGREAPAPCSDFIAPGPDCSQHPCGSATCFACPSRPGCATIRTAGGTYAVATCEACP
jgi:hypothetical protein